MTSKELRKRQGWTLPQKIDHSLGVIDQFISRVKGKAYVAFSGGKDSTVLLHLCRLIKPDIPAVFVNTGCESPSIIKFVRQTNLTMGGGVITLHPKKRTKQVWAEFGFPLVSKQVSHDVHAIRNNPNCTVAKKVLSDDNEYKLAERWRYLLTADYDVSQRCCDILKKQPCHEFEKKTRLRPILGTMASESRLRALAYLARGGCNEFHLIPYATSLPLSIWLDEDIWGYIRDRKLAYADIYDKGATRTGCVGCGFGAYAPDDCRFDILYELYPKYYDMLMRYENNGVTFRCALREMLAVTGKVLPDERQGLFARQAR